MRIVHHLWRRGLARLRLFGRPVSPRGDALLALTDEFEAGDRALRVLLERDGRDTDDMPGFDDLADRQAELVGLICMMPARTLAGVVAKARCARLHPSEQGFDAALALALSACDDLLRLDGARPPRTPLLRRVSGPSRDGYVGTRGKPERPQTADPDGTARVAVLCRNSLHRWTIHVLIDVVRWSSIGTTPLPLGGFERGRAVAAVRLTGGVGATSSVFCPRHADRSERRGARATDPRSGTRRS